MLTDRAYYERQGERALSTGDAFHCSEPTIVEIVIEMARSYLGDAISILDIGCGANLEYDKVLADMGKRPICADFALNFLRLAARDKRLQLIQADATALPFRGASFDAVICSETIEHIPQDGVVIAEIARVLRPQGILLITAPNLWNASRLLESIKQRDITIRMMTGHLREYHPGQLRKLLVPNFTVERWLPVRFGWTGRIGGVVDCLVQAGLLKRLSKSIALVARRRA